MAGHSPWEKERSSVPRIQTTAPDIIWRISLQFEGVSANHEINKRQSV